MQHSKFNPEIPDNITLQNAAKILISELQQHKGRLALDDLLDAIDNTAITSREKMILYEEGLNAIRNLCENITDVAPIKTGIHQ